MGHTRLVRFVTYNIRHCQGMDGLIMPARIARVLGAIDADVIGLNEVWRVARYADQPATIANLLAMEHAFAQVHRRGPLGMGNAVVTRAKLLEEALICLPGSIEGRGCIVCLLDLDGVRFRFASAHMTLHAPTRARAFEVLAAELPRDLPLVLAGDFNAGDEELGPLREVLQVPATPATFPSFRPRASLNHFAFSSQWRLGAMSTVGSLASDHLPLIAELELG